MKDLLTTELRRNSEVVSELTNEIRRLHKILEPELRKTETARRVNQHRKEVKSEGKQFLQELAEKDARKDEGKMK